MNLIHHYVELIAALCGSFYWFKTRDRRTLPFIWYLWLTVTVETLALYPYFYDIDNWFFNYLENSVMKRNTWLYNLYSILGLILVGLFFYRHIHHRLSKNIIALSVAVSTVFTIIYFIVSGNFFKMTLPYDMAVQTVAIFIIVLFYYRELLQSDKILDFYKSHIFYIGSAFMLWNICLTPLFIFDGYFNPSNTEFNQFRLNVLLVSNLLLYVCYSFAFLNTLYHKNRLVLRK
jgi:hypothetical protein